MKERICYVGQPKWAKHLELLSKQFAGDLAEYSHWPIRVPRDVSGVVRAVGASIVVRVGFRPGAATWRGQLFDAGWGVLRGLARWKGEVCYWIGSDVASALVEAASGRSVAKGEMAGVSHLAAAPWLAEELQQIGLDAHSVLFPGTLPQAGDEPTLPQSFRVLTYVPDSRPDLYGGRTIVSLARAFPDVPFEVMGGQGGWAGQIPANLRFLGWLASPVEAYQRSTVVIRLVRHDALGGTVREGLALGRHVIYTYPVPHTVRVPYSEPAAIQRAIADLQAAHESGSLSANLDGMVYARAVFEPGHTTRRLIEALVSA